MENILISDFIWIEQYEFLNIDENIISKFTQAYSYVTKFIKYDLAMPTHSIAAENMEEAGYLCRPIDKERVANIREMW